MKRAALMLAVGCAACEGSISRPAPQVAPAEPQVAAVDCSTKPLPPRRVRRLTRLELEAALSHAVGAPVQAAARLPADPVLDGFDTVSELLTVTPLLAEQLHTLAGAAAATVKADPSRWGSCDDTGAACRDAFIGAFGTRAFRRPLDAAELNDYRELYALAATDGHATAAALVAEAMLQSPFFVYRTELGAQRGAAWELTRPELSQALAFLLTGAPPDDALGGADLYDPAVLEREAGRLLTTPAARAHLGDFVEKWLGLEGLAYVPKSGDHAAALDTAARAAAKEEVRSLHAGAVLDRRSYASLLSSGLLTSRAFLSVYGKPSGSAPVQRGVAVRERMLCEHLPPPPPNVNAEPPPERPGATTRERYAMHEANPGCAACHQRIDPIGFAFERYDGVGRLRTEDNGLPIDARGTVFGLDGRDVHVDGAGELSAALGASSAARRCYVRQWARFGLGSDGTRDAFACETSQLEQQFAGTERPLRDALLALVTSKGFRFREAPAGSDPTATQVPMPAPAPSQPPPVVPPAVELEVQRRSSSDWGAGYCDDVTVKNVGAAAREWRVLLPVTGTITNAWNSMHAAATGGIEFSGADWNKTLAPGATASFGFCANR